MATSSIRPQNEGCAAQAGRYLPESPNSKGSSWRREGGRPAARQSDVTIARPEPASTEPGDRRLLKLFSRRRARARFPTLGPRRRSILPSHVHRRPRRRIPALRRAPGLARQPHVHSRWWGSDDPERAGGDDRRGPPVCGGRLCTCPCGRSGWAGAVCEAICVAARPSPPPIYLRRRGLISSRRGRAFDVNRARGTEIGYAARRSVCAERHRPHARRVIGHKGWL